MVKAVHPLKAIENLPILHGRTPDTDETEAGAAFATLIEYEDGGLFAGRFDGTSPWERHPNGDELVQILEGAAKVTVITGERPAGARDDRRHGHHRPPQLLAPLRSPRRRHRHDEDSPADGPQQRRGSTEWMKYAGPKGASYVACCVIRLFDSESRELIGPTSWRPRSGYPRFIARPVRWIPGSA